MGLDLIISVQSNFDKDEQGRNTYKVTQLANLRGCWVIYNQLSDRLENGFTNCATHTFYGKTFHEILKELQEEFEELSKIKKINGYQEYYQKRRIATLSFEVDTLENFIAANNVPNNDTQDYQVHAWW